jgi:hypothetical protein
MALVMGDGMGKGIGGDRVQPFFEGKRGRRQDNSTVLEADDTTKSGMAARV